MINLEPVDKKRCQADRPNNEGPFTFGGGHKMVRCTNKPSVIATENEPGKDGRKGSMSICADCLTKFMEQMPQGHATFTSIE